MNLSKNVQVMCTKSNELKDVFQKINNKDVNIGYLYCPKNFGMTCKYKPVCPKDCSKAGFCVNGECHCNPNHAGIDCSIKCAGVIMAYHGLNACKK